MGRWLRTGFGGVCRSCPSSAYGLVIAGCSRCDQMLAHAKSKEGRAQERGKSANRSCPKLQFARVFCEKWGSFIVIQPASWATSRPFWRQKSDDATHRNIVLALLLLCFFARARKTVTARVMWLSCSPWHQSQARLTRCHCHACRQYCRSWPSFRSRAFPRVVCVPIAPSLRAAAGVLCSAPRARQVQTTVPLL